MTEAQIEAIARRYCRKLGLDPDEFHGFSFGDDGVSVPFYRWQAYTGKAREDIAMSEAIAEVRATVTEGGV